MCRSTSGATTGLVVLVVEDDPGDLLLITEALAASGRPRTIQVARDGQYALDYLRRIGEHRLAPRPDLILMDLNMPRMDGREALAAIKDDEDLRTIPVVVFTTSRAQTDVDDSYRLHANAYVTKPIDLDDLEHVVQQIDQFYTRVVSLPPQQRQAG